MILVVHLGHGSFDPVAVLFFPKSVFSERALAPKLREIAVHLSRSTRRTASVRTHALIPTC